MLFVHDTLSGRKRKFVPIRKGKVSLYACGPSVYATPHLGNFRTYVFEDAFKRYLLFKGYTVRHVMNITDIEDKAVRAAKGSMKRLRKITRANEKVFKRNSRELNLLPAGFYPRATDNIPQMVRLIKRLLSKKLAYTDESGNVFFDVSKFPAYGRLSHSRFAKPLSRRVFKDDYFQREAGDFLLWKAWRKSDGDICWDSPWGKGRPGWHIECSAMSQRFLGSQFDVHMGGVDNVFAHHENEIAQGQGATGRLPARYWMHVRHLFINGRKMSKSLGNILTVDDLLRMGYSPMAIRAHLLDFHYRRRLYFTFKGLRDFARELKRCSACLSCLKRNKFWKENPAADEAAAAALSEFEASLDNDLDFSRAMTVFCRFVRKTGEFIARKKFGRKNAARALSAIRSMGVVLGAIPA